MARCIYCGKSAGIFRTKHEKCHERHERAVALVPGFFAKFLESNLPVDRFHHLLQNAAEASFVKQEEMKALATTGISQMVNSILKDRLLDKNESARVQELADALHAYLSDDISTFEMQTKIAILREIQDGKIPDLVSVAGPMPIELRQGETVIWIFNHVTAFRKDQNGAAQSAGIELPLDKKIYYGIDAFAKSPLTRDSLKGELNGDVVVTNRNICFIGRDVPPVRLPIARITALRAYADGIHIACEPAPERTVTFALPDSWFAANLILRLVQLSRP